MRAPTDDHPKFEVMRMDVADVEEVLTIEQSVCSHPWTSNIFKDCIRVGYHCWVCKEQSQTVGYMIFSTAVEEMHILNIAIHPEWQRMNLGTLLLQQAEEQARNSNTLKSFLEVRSSNKAAIRLYLKQGYEEIGLRKGYYPSHEGREDAIVMSKSLHSS